MANCASKWPSLFEPLKFQLEFTKFLHCIVISLDDYDLWNTYVCSSSVVQISPPLYICQKIIMHRVIIIALYIVYCKWYSTWYAFYKQSFVDRVEVLIVKESNCVEYIDEFLSLYFNFIDIDTKPYYILHLCYSHLAHAATYVFPI